MLLRGGLRKRLKSINKESLHAISSSSMKVKIFFVSSLVLVLISGGCESIETSSYQEIERFNLAGAITPRVDGDVMLASCWQSQQYRLVCGDVLSLDMPAIMKVSTSELPDWTGKREPYSCRVDVNGNIYLPIIGPVNAAGSTLSELESKISQIYYPQYVVNYPSIVASVTEYQKNRVSIVGAVEKSGIYNLRVDQMSLVNLIMMAGGIKEDGASVIRIRHAQNGQLSSPVVLPVEGMNVPFEDVALANGDMVVVEALIPQSFTVIGMVERPGAFPFTPGVSYNVMQAIAYAGGLDDIADPRYVRIYRQDLDGEIISALFPLTGSEANQTLSVALKPGDIVAVESTPRTRTRKLLSEIIKLNFGVQAMYRMDNKSNE